MKTGIFLTSILLLILLTGCANNVVSPFWELADPKLDEIAVIRQSRANSATVIYNPDTCNKIGEACGFFRLHAYAHFVLSDLIFHDPEFYADFLENRADCWAAQNGRPNEITAAVQFLSDESLHENIKIHGDPLARAENIKSCAIENGRYCPDSC